MDFGVAKIYQRCAIIHCSVVFTSVDHRYPLRQEHLWTEYLMSVFLMLGLVLLPAAMYGLAFALNTARTWFGVAALPRARSAILLGPARRSPVSRPDSSGA
jgi:hypothetical protein